MHKEILSNEQVALLPLIHACMNNFGLVGGTAIALQIGHRRSIDFDLFTFKEFDNVKIRKIIKKNGWKIGRVFKDEEGQFTMLINTVQCTFFHYPFPITFSKDFEKIKMPDILTLAAMKAYALGRRAQWKDYVDLYFIMRDHYPLPAIAKKAHALFGGEFNERILREALVYFDDMNYSDEVTFMPGFAVKDATIRKELVRMSIV